MFYFVKVILRLYGDEFTKIIYVTVSLTEAMAIPLQRLLPRHANHCKLHTLAVKKIREGKNIH